MVTQKIYNVSVKANNEFKYRSSHFLLLFVFVS